jgi:hypothetical protein
MLRFHRAVDDQENGPQTVHIILICPTTAFDRHFTE